MIVFKKKEFTIPEGHYTGPKDIDKVPGAIETITKGALGGAGVGAVAGAVLEDTTVLEGAVTGAKWGTLGGIIAKLFLNYIHKPMSHVKYQEVDKNIRRQFGIFRMSGVTVGDTLDKRAKLDDKFSFNDRNVSQYKINFAIHNNTITMYTFGMTKEELDKTSDTLDYYCKKYFSMEYTAKIINQKVNSYSVDIVFTNYHAMCQFIMELSEKLNTKINLLDNNAIVSARLEEAANGEEERSFSVPGFDIRKHELMKMLLTGISKGIGNSFRLGNNMIVQAVQGAVKGGLEELTSGDLQKLGLPLTRGEYTNAYLKEALKRLHYVEGFNYTIGEETSEANMSLVSGVLIVSVIKKESGDIDKKVWKALKAKIRRSDTGRVIVYTYAMKDKSEFDLVLKKLMSVKTKFNIYDN